jgi:hypothetical protein
MAERGALVSNYAPMEIDQRGALMVTRPELLNETEAAAYIRMSVAYLRSDRCRGAIGNRTPGPAYIKKGHRVHYLRVDLDTWLAAHRVDRTARRQKTSRSKAAA